MDDPSVRIVSSRALVYTNAVDADEDRPPHVRAASAIARWHDALWIVQDDTGFLARVHGDAVTSVALPRGPSGRRRFEVRLGNKLDKLDLESAAIIDDTLVAFGSGTIPIREHVVRVTRAGEVTVNHEARLYAALREAIGGAINIEGVALCGDELWCCHRGNTGPDDRPAVVRLDRGWNVRGIARPDLGSIDGVRLGFTDACAIERGIAFLASAEESDDAIGDGRVLGNQIGIYDGTTVETAPLVLAGKPEGLAIAGDRAWITSDSDDPDIPTLLTEVAINRLKLH